jgi:hypothetical protein
MLSYGWLKIFCITEGPLFCATEFFHVSIFDCVSICNVIMTLWRYKL